MTGKENNSNENGNSVSVNPNSSANAGNCKTAENEVHLADSTLQSRAEYNKDKNAGHQGEDNEMVLNKADEMQSNSGGAAGTDRTGTAERKHYGDTELNKGLEAQAQDLESA